MKNNILLTLICMIGCLQILGYATDSKIIRGLGIASGISPYPKVFCEADGYEPFAASYTISGRDDSDQLQHYPLTSEAYAQLQGPYQRRNVYGALFAYAPRLPEELRDSMLQQALQTQTTLLEELSLPPLTNITLTITPREGEGVPHYSYPVTR